MQDAILFLPTLVWLSLVLLLLACVLGLIFSTRVFYVQARVAWWNRRAGKSSPLYPHSLLAAMAAISAILVFSLTAGESMNLRLALMGVAAATTWVLFDWSARQFVEWADSRDTETRQWRAKAQAAGDALRKIVEPNEIRPATAQMLREGLDAGSVSLYVRGSDDFMPVHHVPAPPATPVVFSAQSLLVRELGRFPGARSVSTARGGRSLPWSKGPALQLAVEQDQLRTLDAHLVVPLVIDRAVAGFFLFGPPNEAKAYSSAAIRYAEAVVRQSTDRLFFARQTQQEVERRSEHVRREAAQDFAVTARKYLLPPEPVDLAPVELAAGWWGSEKNRPLFYDIVSLPRRAAGLLLAEIDAPEQEAIVRLVQLQALVRSRFRAYDEDLPALLSSLRRALKWPDGARPVRIFVARYNPDSRAFAYVNAGFNPPILVRRTQSGADLLRLKGIPSPLDSASDSGWIESRLNLADGDMMVIANEPVTNASGSDAEPWDEGRLVDTLLGWEEHPVGDLVGLARRTIEEHEGPLAPGTTSRLLMVLRVRDRQPSLVQ